VVSTRKGAEGLNLEEGKHVLYAETGAQFQHALLSLLSDRPLSQRLSVQASALVRSEFDWGPLLHRFGSQLESGEHESTTPTASEIIQSETDSCNLSSN
jgi:hypothetical protein